MTSSTPTLFACTCQSYPCVCSAVPQHPVPARDPPPDGGHHSCLAADVPLAHVVQHGDSAYRQNTNGADGRTDGQANRAADGRQRPDEPSSRPGNDDWLPPRGPAQTPESCICGACRCCCCCCAATCAAFTLLPIFVTFLAVGLQILASTATVAGTSSPLFSFLNDAYAGDTTNGGSWQFSWSDFAETFSDFGGGGASYGGGGGGTTLSRSRRVLGVERGATPEEIKQAYRREALKFHPDKCGVQRGGGSGEGGGSSGMTAEECGQRFIAVREAYEALSGGKRSSSGGRGGGSGGSGGSRNQRRKQHRQKERQQQQQHREQGDRQRQRRRTTDRRGAKRKARRRKNPA